MVSLIKELLSKKIVLGGLVVLVIAVTFLTLFTQFSDLERRKGEKTTLKFWGYWEPEIINPILSDYQNTHPEAAIEYEKRDLDRYREVLVQRLDNGLGPDVFYFHSRWLPMLGRQLTPVPKNIYDPKSLESTFWSIAQKELVSGNKVWGVPLSFEGLTLIFNNEIFRSAGLTSPPASWDELRIRYLPTLTVKTKEGEIQTAGIALGEADNVDYATQILQLMMAQNGTNFIKGNRLLLAESFSQDSVARNLGADALSFYTSFSRGPSATWSGLMLSSIDSFSKGRVAMIFVPNTRLNEILIRSQELKTPVDLRVAPTPQLPNRPPVNWGSTWALGVFNQTSYQNAAWEFVRYISSKETADKLLSLEKKFSTIPNIPARMDVAERLINDKYLGPYVTQANNASSFYGVEKTDDRGLNDTISETFHEMINNKGSPEEALKSGSAKISSTLIDYGILTLETPKK